MDDKLTVAAPYSKSELHRALIMAALCDGESNVCGFCSSDDVLTTVDCLKVLGATISIDKTVVSVKGPLKKDASGLKLYIKESASTLRFLLPVLGALNNEGEICVGERLYVRFDDNDVKFYDDIGMLVEKTDGKIRFSKRVEKNNFSVSAKTTSENLSGLLMAAPLLGETSIFASQITSTGYVDLTAVMLSRFGVSVLLENGIFKVSGSYSPQSVTISGDYSAAANLVVLGLLSNGIKINNLPEQCHQPDRRILDICSLCGGKTEFFENSLVVSKCNLLKPFSVDLTITPDLFPIVSVLAAFSCGTSTLYGTDRLINKESNRLLAIQTNLDLMGVRCEQNENALTIFGGNPKSFSQTSFSDHRIYMAFSVAMAALHATPLNDVSANKSYPDFYNDLISYVQTEL